MGQFRFRNRNWNRNRPLFKLDGIGIGIESTTNFPVGIGIEDTILCWNRNRNWNLTTVSGIGIGIECAGIVPSLVKTQHYPPVKPRYITLNIKNVMSSIITALKQLGATLLWKMVSHSVCNDITQMASTLADHDIPCNIRRTDS